jgi:hypothetical protein
MAAPVGFDNKDANSPDSITHYITISLITTSHQMVILAFMGLT